MSSKPKPGTHKIVAVIAAFAPGCEILAGINSVKDQVDHILVVDDSGGQATTEYENLPSNVTVLFNHSNLGIAATLNRGVVEARKRSAQFILTLDQDTIVPETYVSTLVDLYQRARDCGIKVAAASAVSVGGNSYECIHHVDAYVCSIEVLQSGILFSVDSFDQIGYFEEDLFIDGVETEYLLRMHNRGYHVLLAQIDIEHKLGELKQYNLLGRSIYTNNHPAFRRYYITRNRLELLRRYGMRQLSWAVVSSCRLVRQSLLAATIEEDRQNKICAMLFGVRDAVLHRTGRIPREAMRTR